MGQIVKFNIVKSEGDSRNTTVISSSPPISTVEKNLIDAELWGQRFTGNDINGTMRIVGDIYLSSEDIDDEDELDDEETTPTNPTIDDEDDEDEEEISGTLYGNVEGSSVYGKVGYINYPNADSEKSNIADLIKTNADNIEINKTNIQINKNDIATNKTNIASNLSEINNLKTRLTTDETNIANNTSEINSLKTRLTNDETNIDKNKTDIATNKTNINLLDKRVQELENRKQAGYYWSAEANMSGSTPISPIEPVTFVGTDIGSFEVTVEQPYLWRTTDGSSWVLVQCYLPPEPDKYYVCSNFNGSYVLSNGQAFNFPGGFVAFYEQIGSEVKLITPYGLDNWCQYTTQHHQSTGAAIPTLNYPNGMSQIARGYIPRVEGYVYVYTIDDLADINNYQKWTLVQSGSAGGSSFTHSIEYDDWGNASVSPGYNIFTVDTTTHLVGSKPLGQNADDPYIGAQGSTDRWKNETWRKSFVMHILSGFLYKNRGYYNSRLGWAFNYNGAANSIGYAGMWTCRMGGINAPTSNNPNDIGYYCTSSIPYLTGYVYSTSAEGMPFKVEFRFLNIKLGKLTNYKPLGASAANTYDTSSMPYRYWNVEIGDCTYKTS